MAVIPTSWTEHWRGSVGSVSFDGPDYVAVYRLETDDSNDQAKVVLAYVQTARVGLGAPYTYANDVGATTAVAKRIRANRILPSFTHWEVVVEYGTRDQGEDQVDDDGNPTDDPFLWRPRIAVGGNTYRRLVTNAEYRGGYGSVFEGKYPVGAAGLLPMNSAYVPFSNPPLEEDDTHRWVVFSTNVIGIDSKVFEQENYVDIGGFSFNMRGISGETREREAKIRRITAIPRTYQSTDYVEVGFEIDFAPYPSRNWHALIPDRGTSLRACDADPDGRGSTVGSSNTPFPPATPRLRTPTDMHGERTGEIFLMDGDGAPLDVCAGAAPVSSEWRHYFETPFTSIPILKDLIQALP